MRFEIGPFVAGRMPGSLRDKSGSNLMVNRPPPLENGNMDRLLSPPNGSRLVIIAAALIARAMLGWLPLIGGLIGLALIIVVLYQVAMIASHMIRTNPRSV